MKKRVAAALAVVALGVGVGAPAASAHQSGLVNVYVGPDLIDISNNDVLTKNNIGVGAAINVAAQICGVQANVGVLTQEVLRNGQTTVCTAANDQPVTVRQVQ